MADVPAFEDMRITWENRVIRALPSSPILVAIAIAIVVGAVYVASQLLLGFPIDHEPLVLALLIGYAAGVNVHVTVTIERETGFNDDLPEAERSLRYMMVPSEMIAPSRIGGAAGLLLALLMLEIIAWVNGLEPGGTWREFHPSTTAIPILFLLLWLIGRFAYFSLAFSGTWTDLDGEPIDLLDLTPLYDRGRIGLRVALVWIIGVSIGGLFFINDPLWALIPVVVVCILVGTAALIVPVRGVARQVREAKRAELDRVRRDLRGSRDRMRSRGDDAGGRLADLLAYEAKIESVSEWPFDVPTLRRFGLYLLIPLGSMVGGALVERIVDALIER